MINAQLLDYVRAQRAAGLSREAITEAVSAGGWSANDVNEAFMAIDGVKTPPPPPPPVPFPPAGPRTVVTPPSPIQTPQPPTPPAFTPPPAVSAPPIPRPAIVISQNTTGVKKKRGIGSIVALTIFILVLVCAGALALLAYFYPALLTSFIPPLP